jgi:hypothetical protein
VMLISLALTQRGSRLKLRTFSDEDQKLLMYQISHYFCYLLHNFYNLSDIIMVLKLKSTWVGYLIYME